ncbi:MAG: hypothetical protein PVJ92_03235 [Candidatus Dependentiae bacterium]|jgi:hypothetical protein
MQRDIFSGDIVFFYAYDVGDDIDREMVKSQHLVPTYNTPLSARFKNYHIPISYHLRGDDIVSEGEGYDAGITNEELVDGGKEGASCYVLSKIHGFGVLSYCYRVPFVGTLSELKTKVIELKTEYDQRADTYAYDTFKKIYSAITSPHFCNLKNDYFTVHISPMRSTVSSEKIMETYGGDIASLLRLELNPLSFYQQDLILRSRTGYYGDELIVIDSGGSFVFDDKCFDSMELFEFVTIQILELQYFDRLLDRRLNRFYTEHLDSDKTQRGRPISELAQLRVDISVITERLENSIRMSGDEYYTDVYERLVKKLSLDRWREAVQRKLDIIRDLYEVQQTNQDLVFHKRYTLIIVWLIAFEAVVSLFHLFYSLWFS